MNDELPQSLRELGDMQDYVKGRLVDKKDFTQFVQSLVSVWHKLRTTIEQKMSQVEELVRSNTQYIDTEIKAVRSSVDSITGAISKRVDTTDKNIQKAVATLRAELSDIALSIPDEYEDDQLRKEIETVRKLIPKVVTLQEVWDRFSKIEKRIHDIADTKPSVIRQVFGGGRPVHVPMVDDWSALTDGVTKTFYLSKQPRSLNTLKIWGSDFPYILRVNVDFTVAGKLVTLTSEVDAPSQGSTLVCEFYV